MATVPTSLNLTMPEQSHAEPTTERVPDGVADDSSDGGGRADRDGTDIERVPGGQQRRADERDLPGQRDTETFDADDTTDEQIHRNRRNRLQQPVNAHPAHNAASRRIEALPNR